MGNIATGFPYESFDPGNGLPIVYKTGTVASDTQEALIRAEAVAAGVPIVAWTGPTSSAGGSVADQYFASGIAVIGDMGNSIALNGTLANEGSSLNGAVSLGSLSYFAYALPQTKGRLRYGGVSATHGFTTDQIIATHLPLVLQSNWQYVHLMVQSNDVPLIVAGTMTETQSKNNVMTIVDALRAAGKKPILSTMPPQGSALTPPGNVGASLAVLTRLNLWVKKYANELHIPYADYHTALVNPSDNNFLAGYSADGVHPLAPGAQAMGNVLATVLNSLPNLPRQPLVGSYNPTLMSPDACLTSTGSDKATFIGSTTGGWSLKNIPGAPFIKGNIIQFARGSNGDYTGSFPNTSAWVAGNKVRLAFALDVPACPSGGSWSAQLYNYTDLKAICGFSGMVGTQTNRSLVVTDGVTVTTGTTPNPNVITCATSKPFRPQHVGCLIASGTGITTAFPAGTTIIGVSSDGTQATCSNNATLAQTGATVVVVGEPQVSVWEFVVQPDMVGKDIRFQYTGTTAAGVSLWAGQVTLQDVTALGL